jgi:hypothetical protein
MEQIDLAPWGYAPGMTLFYCCDCHSDGPEQGHRHSTRCSTHALEARMRDIRMYEASPIDHDTVDVQLLKPCRSNFWIRLMFIGGVIGAGIIGGVATSF